MNVNKLRHLIVIKAGAEGANLSSDDFPLIDELLNEAGKQFARDTLVIQRTATGTTNGDVRYELPDGFIKPRFVLVDSEEAKPLDIYSMTSVIAGESASDAGWSVV